MESSKKNKVIKEFVVKTLVEKVGETRKIKIILEVMKEEFAKIVGEKTAEMMRKISGNCFKTEEIINVTIDMYEEVVTEVEKIKMVDNLKYAMSLQFSENL